MKEFTIELPTKKEYTYIVQNKNTNCIFIRNFNNVNIVAGTKLYPHDVIIPPYRTGVISRPFPIDYIYLQSSKQIPIEIIEAKTKNPVDNLVQQEISKVININLEGLETVEISRDEKNNIDVFVQNTPKIGQAAIKPIHILHVHRPPRRAPVRAIFRIGSAGRRIINICAKTTKPHHVVRLNVVLTNDVDLLLSIYEFYIPIALRRYSILADYNGRTLSINDNSYTEVYVGTFRHTWVPIQIVISASR
jgi:hypothetical protein